VDEFLVLVSTLSFQSSMIIIMYMVRLLYCKPGCKFSVLHGLSGRNSYMLHLL